ncbi:MAG: alpha/beta hydrolase [Paracoccaceae bacterium]
MADPAPLYNELAEAPEFGRAFWIKSGRRRLRAAVWEGGGRGHVVIFGGRSEYIEKWGRVVSQLVQRGFSVATLDWRGQGLSDRALGNQMKGHVSDFAAYQRDVEAFLKAPEVAALAGPQVLFCHSMGGCIGMRALLDERIAPAATVMTAPMLGIEFTPLARCFIDVMIMLARRFGFESSFIPAPKAGLPYVSHQAFEGNVLTGDAEHYAWFAKHLEAEPGFALGSPTLGWMAAALDESAALSQAPAPDGPMLMLLGEDESVVSPARIRAFVARNPACRLVELVGGRHEVFLETAEIRRILWAEIDSFLTGNHI